MKIKLIIDRLYSYYQVNTNIDLAAKLGVSPTRLSNWKSRNSIDWEIIFTKCVDINLNWLVFGIGDMNINSHSINNTTCNLCQDKDSLIKSQNYLIQHQQSEISRLDTIIKSKLESSEENSQSKRNCA